MEEASAGNIVVAVAGFAGANIAITCPNEPQALIKVDEPTLQMTFR